MEKKRLFGILGFVELLVVVLFLSNLVYNQLVKETKGTSKGINEIQTVETVSKVEEPESYLTRLTEEYLKAKEAEGEIVKVTVDNMLLIIPGQQKTVDKQTKQFVYDILFKDWSNEGSVADPYNVSCVMVLDHENEWEFQVLHTDRKTVEYLKIGKRDL